jgi:hypothetical protein
LQKLISDFHFSGFNIDSIAQNNFCVGFVILKLPLALVALLEINYKWKLAIA